MSYGRCSLPPFYDPLDRILRSNFTPEAFQTCGNRHLDAILRYEDTRDVEVGLITAPCRDAGHKALLLFSRKRLKGSREYVGHPRSPEGWFSVIVARTPRSVK